MPCFISQAVVDDAARYSKLGWRFFFTNTPRQNGTTHMSDYAQHAGMATFTGVSMANLLIASECDFFVGTLGSNWNRLINELRCTSGRLQAGYVALNYGQY